jgi:hypothetical protein
LDPNLKFMQFFFGIFLFRGFRHFCNTQTSNSSMDR